VSADGALVEYLLRLGDDRLVLGHRLSEWCGYAPILEEELALGNVALDFLGQATALLDLAGRVEGRSRTADDLAYFREAVEFRNSLLVERPNGDFACTIARQFLFDAYDVPLATALRGSRNDALARLAAKAAVESVYHLRHSREWVLRLGDGTEESHRRIERAFSDLWTYTAELFCADSVDESLVATGVGVNPATLREPWQATVSATLSEAGIALCGDSTPPLVGGRHGRHSEHLGRMLAEMQIVARSFPGAHW